LLGAGDLADRCAEIEHGAAPDANVVKLSAMTRAALEVVLYTGGR
jgi:hypothetical protein